MYLIYREKLLKGGLMLKTLKILGETENLHIVKQEEKGQKEEKILFINIDLKNKTLQVDTQDYNSLEAEDKYLFQEGDQKGTTCAFLKTIPQNTSEKLNIKSKFFGMLFFDKQSMLNTISQKHNNVPDIVNFCSDVKDFINSDRFKQEIKNKIQEIKDKIDEMKIQKIKRIFSCCKINGKYFGEIEIQGKRIFYDYYVEIYQKNKFKQSKELTCFCCHQKKPTSPVSPFAFHTFDKPGYSINFNSEHIKHVSYPLCYDCYSSIKSAWNVIKDYSLLFCGIKYYIFPKFLFQEDKDLIVRVFRDIYRYYLEHNKEKVRNYEDNIFRNLSKENDVFLLDFVFFNIDKHQNVKIQLYIEDVYPSRLRKIIEANDKVFEKIQVERSVTIYSGILYSIFAETQKGEEEQKIIRQSFLHCLNCIFKNIPLETEWMYKWFNKYISKKYVDAIKNNNMKIYNNALLNVEMVYQFLRNLNLLKV